MSTSGFIRWSGLAALVGGALWVVVFAAHAWGAGSGPAEGPPLVSFRGLGLPGLLALLLIGSGFVGLDMPSWRRDGGGYGRLGRIGFDLAGLAVFVVFVSGSSGSIGLIGAFLLSVGSVLVGVAALRTGLLPRWGAATLVVGSLAFLMFDTEGLRSWFGVLYGAAWVAVGYLMWAGIDQTAQQPTRVR
jgi:hypothetical protein